MVLVNYEPRLIGDLAAMEEGGYFSALPPCDSKKIKNSQI
jgi:hypothetical protein